MLNYHQSADFANRRQRDLLDQAANDALAKTSGQMNRRMRRPLWKRLSENDPAADNLDNTVL
ncbi:MAG: hypothetical protein ACOCX3_00015 [Chloroflexota bacterium]